LICDITNVKRVFGTSDICDLGYVLKDNRCSKISCTKNSTLVGNQCFCNQGYIAIGNICITYTQNCQNKYGSNSYGDNNYCYCNNGYEWNSAKTNCIKILTSHQNAELNQNSEAVRVEIPSTTTTTSEKQQVEEEGIQKNIVSFNESQTENKNISKEKQGFLVSISNFLGRVWNTFKSFFHKIFK
jgi:hypothetical protein